jgi:hypothetical protein
MNYWGVNSWNRANQSIGRRTLWEIVYTYGRNSAPEFWGRYIGVGPHTRTPVLTEAEAEFIFSESDHRCKILVIYNGAGGSQVAGNRQVGIERARDAASRAAGAGVPPGVRLYLDVEPQWRPSAEFFLGWWEGMASSAYASMGGVYANPDFSNIFRPYFAALRALSLHDRQFYTRYHWSTRPGLGCTQHPLQVKENFRPRRLGQRPDIAVPGELADWNDPVVLWQYARSCLGTGHGLVDLDIADSYGYADLWASPRAQ